MCTDIVTDLIGKYIEHREWDPPRDLQDPAFGKIGKVRAAWVSQGHISIMIEMVSGSSFGTQTYGDLTTVSFYEGLVREVRYCEHCHHWYAAHGFDERHAHRSPKVRP